MKLRKLLALLLFPLFVQPVMAQNNSACPNEEQIKHIEIISSKKNAAGDWIFTSAPFQADGAAWEVSFVQYQVAGSIPDAQYTWDHAKIRGPFTSMCDYLADWDSSINWILVMELNK